MASEATEADAEEEGEKHKVVWCCACLCSDSVPFIPNRDPLLLVFFPRPRPQLWLVAKLNSSQFLRLSSSQPNHQPPRPFDDVVFIESFPL